MAASQGRSQTGRRESKQQGRVQADLIDRTGAGGGAKNCDQSGTLARGRCTDVRPHQFMKFSKQRLNVSSLPWTMACVRHCLQTSVTANSHITASDLSSRGYLPHFKITEILEAVNAAWSVWIECMSMDNGRLPFQ